MKKINILFALMLLAAGAMAQGWTLDKSHAKVGFTITHLMVSEVDGNFKGFDATLTSSKDDLSDAVFEVSADVATIDTDSENRDNDLKGERWFNVAQFPKWTFKSTSFTKVDGKKYKVMGDLTMKGVTKPVELDLTMNGPVEHPRSKKPLVGFSATGVIKRTDFGVGGAGNVPVSEEVTIIAKGEFGKK